MLLLDIIIDGAIGFHFLDLLETRDGAFNGVKIRQSAAEPAFSDMILPAFLSRFLHGLLGLFLCADEQNLSAFADGRKQEIRSGFELIQRLAEVDDVNAIASVEDEGLHLGIPALRLVAEMDTRIQQFLNTNTNHNFPLVKSSFAR